MVIFRLAHRPSMEFLFRGVDRKNPLASLLWYTRSGVGGARTETLTPTRAWKRENRCAKQHTHALRNG